MHFKFYTVEPLLCGHPSHTRKVVFQAGWVEIKTCLDLHVVFPEGVASLQGDLYLPSDANTDVLTLAHAVCGGHDCL